MRFEGGITVSLRGGPKLALKVWATVELPKVRLDKEHWFFGNVYAGSTALLPVTISNEVSAVRIFLFAAHAVVIIIL